MPYISLVSMRKLFDYPIEVNVFFLFAAIPINLMTIDTLGRRWTLTIDYLLACLFFLLLQVCTGRTGLTIIIFGIRAATAGIFNTIYIYTTEVSKL